jgi:hypothetical protein
MENSERNIRNKKILLVIGIVFTAFVMYTTYDIMSRTTRPGAKKHLPHSILK